MAWLITIPSFGRRRSHFLRADDLILVSRKRLRPIGPCPAPFDIPYLGQALGGGAGVNPICQFDCAINRFSMTGRPRCDCDEGLETVMTKLSAAATAKSTLYCSLLRQVAA